MKRKHYLFMTVLSLVAVSCATDEQVLVNPDPQGDAITFSPSVGRATRAQETTILNLGDFGVIARGLDSHGSYYDELLIGTVGTDNTISPAIATRNSKNGTTWELDHNVYWPTGVNKIRFFAATVLQKDNSTSPTEETETPSATTDRTSEINGGASPTWDLTKLLSESYPIIENYSPIKAERKKGNDYTTYIDGQSQNDLVVAYTEATKKQSSSETTSGSQTNIDLSFHHALSQIDIQATAGKGLTASETEHIVKIKGVWIVNSIPTGDLKYKLPEAGKDNSFFSWETASINKQNTIGSYFDKPITLNKTAKTILDPGSQVGDEMLYDGNLMLIPSRCSKWDGNLDDDGETILTYDEYKEKLQSSQISLPGAYILLLCRIELKHSGVNHDTDNGDGPGIHTEGNSHFHQLFPVNKDKVQDKDNNEIIIDKWDDTKYGYTCVPIEINWEAGKKYTYTLDICGATTGGGVYPPVIPDDVPGIDPVVPDDKKPGDPVLDTPISFTVTVSSYTTDDKWIELK